MITLAQYTSAALIVPRLRGQDAAAAIGELCEVLSGQRVIKNPAPFFSAVMRREELCSTATEPGWSLPHARVGEAAQLSFALGRSERGLAWPGTEGSGVRLVFLFVIPESGTSRHLSVVSGLARLSSDPLRAQALLDAPDSLAMHQLLGEVPLGQTAGARQKAAANPAPATSPQRIL